MSLGFMNTSVAFITNRHNIKPVLNAIPFMMVILFCLVLPAIFALFCTGFGKTMISNHSINSIFSFTTISVFFAIFFVSCFAFFAFCISPKSFSHYRVAVFRFCISLKVYFLASLAFGVVTIRCVRVLRKPCQWLDYFTHAAWFRFHGLYGIANQRRSQDKNKYFLREI